MFSLFKFILRLKRIPIHKATILYAKLQEEYQTNPEQYAKKRWGIFNYHTQHNSFYRKLLGPDKIIHWEDIPVMSKAIFQKAKHQIITPEHLHNSYTSKTSGSSGVPLFYHKSKMAHALTWADAISVYKKHGIEYGSSLQARFYAIPLEKPAYYIERLKDFLSARDRFIIHDMSDEKLKTFLIQFRKRKFKYMYGYTNSLVLFARFLLREQIILKSVCPSILTCIVTSEVCSDEDRNILKSAFGVNVINEYGASEIGLIAFEDINMDWRVSNELLYVEILDDENRVLPEGEIGKITITSYFNEAMPFIRYEVGDRGVLWRNEQGVLFLRRLYGRLNDVLRLSNGKVIPGFTLYYATKAMMEMLPNMREYNIRQTKLTEITFDIVIDGELDSKVKNEVQNVVCKYLGTNIEIIFNKIDKIERLSSGKMKHFQVLESDYSNN